jgi:3-methyladenine DNA glycosylase Tag
MKFPHGTENVVVVEGREKIEKAINENQFITVVVQESGELRSYNRDYILAILENPTVQEQSYEDTLRQ